jgi:hypothetical protein
MGGDTCTRAAPRAHLERSALVPREDLPYGLTDTFRPTQVRLRRRPRVRGFLLGRFLHRRHRPSPSPAFPSHTHTHTRARSLASRLRWLVIRERGCCGALLWKRWKTTTRTCVGVGVCVTSAANNEEQTRSEQEKKKLPLFDLKKWHVFIPSRFTSKNRECASKARGART